MKADATNIPLWWARCDLLEKTGDKKKAVEGYQQILNLLPREDGDKYLQLARDMTKVFSFLKLKFRRYSAIHTNYNLSAPFQTRKM